MNKLRLQGLQVGNNSCTVQEIISSENKPCIFPFTYENQTFHDCTTFNDTEPWCSTKTYNESNQHFGDGYFGYCDSNCEANQTIDFDCESNNFKKCACIPAKQCSWSKKALAAMSRLNRQSPKREKLIQYMKNRICDKESNSVYCCENAESNSDDSNLKQKKSEKVSKIMEKLDNLRIMLMSKLFRCQEISREMAQH